MTKQALLDDIRRKFERALDERYEDFEVSIRHIQGELHLRTGGCYEGCKSTATFQTVNLEQPQESLKEGAGK